METVMMMIMMMMMMIVMMFEMAHAADSSASELSLNERE